jgi:hypothetical protein
MGSYYRACCGHTPLSLSNIRTNLSTQENPRVVSGFGYVYADIVGSAYYKWVSVFLDFPERLLAIRITVL